MEILFLIFNYDIKFNLIIHCVKLDCWTVPYSVHHMNINCTKHSTSGEFIFLFRYYFLVQCRFVNPQRQTDIGQNVTKTKSNDSLVRLFKYRIKCAMAAIKEWPQSNKQTFETNKLTKKNKIVK